MVRFLVLRHRFYCWGIALLSWKAWGVYNTSLICRNSNPMPCLLWWAVAKIYDQCFQTSSSFFLLYSLESPLYMNCSGVIKDLGKNYMQIGECPHIFLLPGISPLIFRFSGNCRLYSLTSQACVAFCFNFTTPHCMDGWLPWGEELCNHRSHSERFSFIKDQIPSSFVLPLVTIHYLQVVLFNIFARIYNWYL